MIIDAIILTNTVKSKHHQLTQSTINTLNDSEKNHKFKIHLIETNDKCDFVYKNIFEIINPNIPFNYNKFLNIGFKECKSDWVLISNNDLIYTKGWLTNILNVHRKDNEIKSFSPYEPMWHFNKGLIPNKEYQIGHKVSYELCGWCLLIHRSIIEPLNLFDERFEFWYQDNDYSETLKYHNIKHALVFNSVVYHAVSGSRDLKNYENSNNELQKYYQLLQEKWLPILKHPV